MKKQRKQKNVFVDAKSTKTKHRSKDRHGNPDDKYTEKEAVAMAKSDGLIPVDTFQIMKIDKTDPLGGDVLVNEELKKQDESINVPLQFDTSEEAQNHIDSLESPKSYTVLQVRTMVQSTKALLLGLFIGALGFVSTADAQKYPLPDNSATRALQQATTLTATGQLQYGTPVEYDPGTVNYLQPAGQRH